MKRKILALALAAALLLPLVGCGGNDTANGGTANGNGTTNGDGNGNGTTQDGTSGGAGTGTDTDNGVIDDGLAGTPDGENGVTNGDTAGNGATGTDSRARMGGNNGDTVFTDNGGSTFGRSGWQVQNERMPGTVYDGTQWPAQQTATWAQMLDNGYVHDSDGFLLDGENSSW